MKLPLVVTPKPDGLGVGFSLLKLSRLLNPRAFHA